MKKFIYTFSFILLFASCKQEQVDLIVTNANIYTVDKAFSNAEAFAIKDGKFVAVGTAAEITNKYAAPTTFDAQGQTIVPGLMMCMIPANMKKPPKIIFRINICFSSN